MTGEYPRTTLHFRDGEKDFHSLIGQGDMASLAGLGNRYGQDTLLKVDMLPASFSDLAFTGTSEYEQLGDLGLRLIRTVKLVHDLRCLCVCEIAFAHSMNLEGRNFGTGTLP